MLHLLPSQADCKSSTPQFLLIVLAKRYFKMLGWLFADNAGGSSESQQGQGHLFGRACYHGLDYYTGKYRLSLCNSLWSPQYFTIAS